jgi:hypothetical protein
MIIAFETSRPHLNHLANFFRQGGEGNLTSIRFATHKGLGKFQGLIRCDLGREWRL